MDLGVSHPQEFCFGVPQKVFRPLVRLGDCSPGIGQHDGIAGAIHQTPILLFRLPQRLFHPPAFGAGPQGLDAVSQIVGQANEQVDFLVIEGIDLGGIDGQSPEGLDVRQGQGQDSALGDGPLPISRERAHSEQAQT